MTHGLRRFQQAGTFHFLTFSCHRRRPYLRSAITRDLFEACLERIRKRYMFVVLGYVVMPEHVHLLVNEPTRGTLDRVMQALKLFRLPQTGANSVLAGTLLRLQRLESGEDYGEAGLHAPEPGEARTGGEARGMAVVELLPLQDRFRGNR